MHVSRSLRGKPSEGVWTVLLRGKPGRYKSSHVLAMLAVPSTVHYSSSSSSSSNGRSTAKNKKTETKDELVPCTNDMLVLVALVLVVAVVVERYTC